MNTNYIIAVDAMGGEGSPIKIIDGITHHYKNNKNVFYKIFGDQNHINPLILKKIDKKSYEIIHTTEKVFFRRKFYIFFIFF